MAAFHSRASVNDRNHSSETQAISKGQLIEENPNDNLTRNFQSINFPGLCAGNTIIKLRICKL